MLKNREIQQGDVPRMADGWERVYDFAHTFDGFLRLGSFEKCAEIANSRSHNTPTELRACLFFEARHWRHFGEEPDSAGTAYLDEVLLKIKDRLGDDRTD